MVKNFFSLLIGLIIGFSIGFVLLARHVESNMQTAALKIQVQTYTGELAKLTSILDTDSEDKDLIIQDHMCYRYHLINDRLNSNYQLDPTFIENEVQPTIEKYEDFLVKNKLTCQ